MDYRFYGYKLRSEVPLPTLAVADHAAADERDGGDADILLRRGTVQEHLPDPIWKSPFLEIGGDGTVLAKVGSSLRFHVAGGREITLQAALDQTGQEVETHLSSLVAGALLHQRGDFALHASCVAVDGTAVALCGPSGRGKSTLASALVLAGHVLLSDDVCVIRFTENGSVAIPGPPRLRLWPDMARVLGQHPESLPCGREGHPKRLLMGMSNTAMHDDSVGLPLGVLVRLTVDRRVNQPVLEKMTGPAAVMPIDDLVYRTRLGRRMSRGADIFRNLMRLAGMVRVYSLTRPDGPPDLPRLVELVRSTIE